MKVKGKLLLLVIIPTILLGACSYITSSMQMTRKIKEQAYNGMAATALSIREVWKSSVEGDYWLDENGDMWKGNYVNLSKNIDLVDSVKNNTGYDMTVFYGDTRVLTTVVDENGKRQIGTKASDEVIKEVIQNGKDFKSDNTNVLGNRYICYYVPLFQSDGGKPVGMIFLGMPYKNVSNVVIQSGQMFGVALSIVEILSIVGGLLISIGIVKALSASVDYLTSMSQGTLDIKMDQKILSRKDEIGDTCRAIGVLKGRLVDIIKGIQEQALEVEETANNCNDRAGQVQEVAQQVDIAVGEITNSATQQASEATQAKSSVGVIGDVIKQTDGELKDFLTITNSMDKASENAKNTLKELNDYMISVEKAVEEISYQTNETHISVEKISQMTEVIAEIASETNLLSLNASIEAARAGEAGRGFAVVASEIQKLADQSNASAGEIQEILVQLRTNSETSVKAMDNMSKIMEEQEKKLKQTNVAFDTVDNGIEKSVQGIDRIVQGMNTLEGARVETLTVVDNVSNFAQQNAAATQETVASMDEVTSAITEVAEKMRGLLELAQKMQETAGIFKI